MSIQKNIDEQIQEEILKGAVTGTIMGRCWIVRKISLSNYDPRKKFETEDYGYIGASFAECRSEIERVVGDRIKELKGFREIPTKE